MKQYKKGVSLIVLVITIVITIILAGSIVLTLTTSGLINKSKKTLIYSDLSALQEELVYKISENLMKRNDNNSGRLSDFGINNQKYEAVCRVVDGKLVVLTSANDEIKEVAKELGIGIRGEIISSNNGIISLDTRGDNILNYRIYGNSIQNTTPTINNPVEIQSVGEKTANLFDCNIVTAGDFKLNVYSSNSYGTTVNSNTYNGKIEVTQTKYPDSSNLSSYTNGYFSIRLNGLENGKTYTLIYDFEVLSNPLNTDKQYLIFNGATKQYIPAISGNRAKTVFVWNATSYSSLEFRIAGKSMIYKNFMILEGEIEGFPEYEPVGYKIPIELSGKNLINPNSVEQINGYINSQSGQVFEPSSTGGTWRCSDYIAISGGKSYVLNAVNNDANYAGIAWYDSNKNYVSGLNTTSINSKNGEITAPVNASYVRVSWRIDDGYNPNWRNTVQFEEGSIVTAYEPYVSPQTYNIYIDEPLRKVGEYADYIDFGEQKIVRNIKEIILDGDENFIASTEGEGRYYLTGLTPCTKTGTFTDILCSHYVGGMWENNDNVCSIFNQTIFRIRNDSILTVEDLKNWVTSNNLKVYYPIANPQKADIDIPEIETYNGLTNIKVDTKISPSSMEFEY